MRISIPEPDGASHLAILLRLQHDRYFAADLATDGGLELVEWFKAALSPGP